MATLTQRGAAANLPKPRNDGMLAILGSIPLASRAALRRTARRGDMIGMHLFKREDSGKPGTVAQRFAVPTDSEGGCHERNCSGMPQG